MSSIPISPNKLGLENSQQGLGFGLLAVGVVACALALLRYLITSTVPLSPLEWLLFASLLVLAARRIYVGLSLIFSFVIDTKGPTYLSQPMVEEMLRTHTVWRHDLPSGLLGNVLYRLAPKVYFLTPPFQGLIRGMVAQFLIGLCAFGLLVYMGKFAVPLVAVVIISTVGRGLALRYAVVTSSKQQPLLAKREGDAERPGVEIYEQREHLKDAGNPTDLYFHLRDAFEELRERSFPNMTLCDREPDIGVNAASNKFSADLIVETQPMPMNANKRASPPALILGAFGLVLEPLGCALLLFAGIFTGSLEELIMWKVASMLSLWYGSAFFLMAHRILCTFRFRSDLIWLHFDGSYQLHRLSVGGGFSGLPGTEGHSIKSDIFMHVRATRLVSECTPDADSMWEQILGIAHLATRTLQTAPRYVVRTQRDSAFQERLDRITKGVVRYEDDAARLRTPDMQSPDVQNMVAIGLNILNAQEAIRNQHGQGISGGLGHITNLPNPPTGQTNQSSNNRPSQSKLPHPALQKTKRLGPPPPPPPPPPKKNRP